MKVELLSDRQSDVLGARHHPRKLLELLVLLSHQISLQLQDAAVVELLLDVHARLHRQHNRFRGTLAANLNLEILETRAKLPEHALTTTRFTLRHYRVGKVLLECVELGGEGDGLRHHRRREPGGFGAVSERRAAVPFSDGGERIVDQLLDLLEPDQPLVTHKKLRHRGTGCFA